MRLSILPTEIQEKVKSTLRAFDTVYVDYENGQYHVSTGVALKAEYADDHKCIGTYKADDVFTEKEKIENYINEFHEYPIYYTGKRDYQLLKKMDSEREFSEDYKTLTQWIGQINADGDFVLTGKETINTL